MYAVFLTSVVLAATAHAAHLLFRVFPFRLMGSPKGENAVTDDTGKSDSGSVSGTSSLALKEGVSQSQYNVYIFMTLIPVFSARRDRKWWTHWRHQTPALRLIQAFCSSLSGISAL
ncbi:hypothetical protein BXZ70DRAFT_364344 [Cristinia sonorae]|uniref:Uncharacterized protein n=1 Tax=Cristinia sonorae TaxID=1940300 RepID=A0A8K0UJA5_9AGAR|nr:hypothetical protein BXZ70DRAFT_364344 [Cristinia sonorae]